MVILMIFGIPTVILVVSVQFLLLEVEMKTFRWFISLLTLVGMLVAPVHSATALATFSVWSAWMVRKAAMYSAG